MGEITTGESAVAFTPSDHPVADRYNATHCATSSYMLHRAVAVVLDCSSAAQAAQCDEAGIRQIASWETQPRPLWAPWEHLGPADQSDHDHDVMCHGYIFRQKDGLKNAKVLNYETQSVTQGPMGASEHLN